MQDGATGELVLTHLVNRSAPLLRFRTRDHVRVGVGRCACGRTAPRVRCIGRTDDMLIVRGVNVFPSAVREVVNEFTPEVTRRHADQADARRACGRSRRCRSSSKLAEGASEARVSPSGSASACATSSCSRAEINLAPAESLPRSEYKSKLVAKT